MSARPQKGLVLLHYKLFIIRSNEWKERVISLKQKTFITYRHPNPAARKWISDAIWPLHLLFKLFLMKKLQTWPSVVPLVRVFVIVLLLWMRKILAAGFGFLYAINDFRFSWINNTYFITFCFNNKLACYLSFFNVLFVKLHR